MSDAQLVLSQKVERLREYAGVAKGSVERTLSNFRPLAESWKGH